MADLIASSRANLVSYSASQEATTVYPVADGEEGCKVIDSPSASMEQCSFTGGRASWQYRVSSASPVERSGAEEAHTSCAIWVFLTLAAYKTLALLRAHDMRLLTSSRVMPRTSSVR